MGENRFGNTSQGERQGYYKVAKATVPLLVESGLGTCET
jgi:hypothetical protein